MTYFDDLARNLKPCPLCGSKRVVLLFSAYPSTIFCKDCGGELLWRNGDFVKAAQAWDRRTDRTGRKKRRRCPLCGNRIASRTLKENGAEMVTISCTRCGFHIPFQWKQDAWNKWMGKYDKGGDDVSEGN